MRSSPLPVVCGSLLFQVEFDIDTGPTVDGVFPPLNLQPAESETLYVHVFMIGLNPKHHFQQFTVHFVHCLIPYNSIKGLRPILFAYASGLRLSFQKTSRVQWMDLCMDSRTSFRRKIPHQNGVINRYFGTTLVCQVAYKNATSDPLSS